LLISGANGIGTIVVDGVGVAMEISIAIDDTVAQSIAYSADGGTVIGVSPMYITDHLTANTFELVAGPNITIEELALGKLKFSAAGGSVGPKWGKCQSNWNKNTGDWKVSVKHSTRSGTVDGAAFDVYLPVVSSQDPNLVTNDRITYMEADDGVKTITSDYLDEKIGMIKMWPFSASSIPAGWGRMNGTGNTTTGGVGSGFKFHDSSDTVPNSHTQRFPLAYDGATPPGTPVGHNLHTHDPHDQHTHKMGVSTNGLGPGGTGGDQLNNCTGQVAGTDCETPLLSNALAHADSETVPRALEVHMIERIDNSL
jgi:hypothetical protein